MKFSAKSILLTSMRSPYLDSDRTYPPLGLLYLKSYLNQFGINVGLEDEFDFDSPEKYESFDAFGASVMTPQRQSSLDFLNFCKKNYKGKPVVIGGPHAKHYLDDVTKEDWDYIVPFDGQRSLLRILMGSAERIDYDFLSKTDWASMPRPDRTSIEAMELLSRYNYSLGDRRSTTMLTALGCPERCFDKETEIYTNSGWKKFCNLLDEDKVLTYNKDTKFVEFETPIRRIEYHYKGSMISVKNGSLDMVLTPNHQNFCNTNDGAYKGRSFFFEDADELMRLGKTQQRIFLKGCAGNNDQRDTVIIGSLKFKAVPFFKFLGYYLAEGYCPKDDSGIWIYQSEKSKYFEDIIHTIKELGFKPFIVNRENSKAIIFKKRELHDYLAKLGRSWEKYVPQDLLQYNTECLSSLIDGLFNGDGTTNYFPTRSNNKPLRKFRTTSKNLADDVQYITFLLGKAAHINIIHQKDRMIRDTKILASHSRVCYDVGIPISSAKAVVMGSHVSEVNYDDKVYCVETKNGIILVRRNNKVVLSSNCKFCEDAQTAVRWSNIETIRDELDDIMRLGYGGVYIFDDLFAIALKMITPICNELKKRDLIYRCNGQARYFNEEFAKLLSDTGCYEIAFGAETGSQKILDSIEKRTTVEMNYKFVELCKKYDIICKAFLMIGLPGETYETIAETERFIRNAQPDDFQLSIYYPYKGTKLRDAIDRGEDNFDLSFSGEGLGAYGQKGGSTESVVRTAALSSAELLAERDRLVRMYKPESHTNKWETQPGTDHFFDTHLKSKVEYD